LPGPLAEERGVPRGTIMGDTNTAREPSLLSDAVPSSLIVLRRILAYSKSTAATYMGGEGGRGDEGRREERRKGREKEGMREGREEKRK
jgi:hypothetical protein